MNTAGVRRDRMLAASRGVPLDLRWLVLAGLVCAVFVGAYEIGSATREKTGGAGGSSELPVAAVNAPILLSPGKVAPITLLPTPRPRGALHHNHKSRSGPPAAQPSVPQTPVSEAVPAPVVAAPVVSRPPPSPPAASQKPPGKAPGSFDSSG